MRSMFILLLLVVPFAVVAQDDKPAGLLGLSVVSSDAEAVSSPPDASMKDGVKDASPQENAKPAESPQAADTVPAQPSSSPTVEPASPESETDSGTKGMLVVPLAEGHPDSPENSEAKVKETKVEAESHSNSTKNDTSDDERDTSAADTAVVGAVEDGVVPPAFPLSRYSDLWENSPFQLESIAPPQISGGLAQRYALTGIAYIDGDPMIFLMERATQNRLLLKKDTDLAGISLVQVDEQKKYEDSTVTIRSGGEVGVVKFDAAPASAFAQPMQQPHNTGAAPPPYIPPGAPPHPNQGYPGGNPNVQAQMNQQRQAQINQQRQAQMNQQNMHNPAPTQGPGGVVQQNQGIQQQQVPGQQPAGGPRVIRRRAIVPTAP